MPFSLDSHLGIHQPALHLQSRRAQVLASNLATVDTPHYKARDIDFKGTIQAIAAGNTPGHVLTTTNQRHQQPYGVQAGYELAYRQPYQSSLDGNTVEHQIELAAYSDNAMRYLTTLRFVSGKFNGLRTAIRGQ